MACCIIATRVCLLACLSAWLFACLRACLRACVLATHHGFDILYPINIIQYTHVKHCWLMVSNRVWGKKQFEISIECFGHHPDESRKIDKWCSHTSLKGQKNVFLAGKVTWCCAVVPERPQRAMVPVNGQLRLALQLRCIMSAGGQAFLGLAVCWVTNGFG